MLIFGQENMARSLAVVPRGRGDGGGRRVLVHRLRVLVRFLDLAERCAARLASRWA